jgi:TctA family transporter
MATPAAGAINKSFKDILFDFDKSDIRANETNKITDVAAYIKQNPTFQVGINGYADPRGTEQYNQALSERRVNAIRDALVKAGVASDKINALAFGEQKPLCSESTERAVFTAKVTNLWPTKDDFRRCIGPILRGTGIGAFFGVLPGTGPAIASFASYMVEKKVADDPSRFGKGAIEGVAGPESANNADAQCKFIPMLTLGIPASAVMALMLGALTIQGIAPGPQVMTQKPDLFWGLVASMWVGNLMLVILNLPLIGMWVKLLTVPYRYLFPSILVFMAIGVYSLSNNPFDVLIMAVFGIIGYVCAKLECEPAPMILGFILGPLMEENLRRAMLLSRGDPTVFFTKPISAAFMIASLILLVVVALPAIRKRREEAFAEETK